MATVTDLRNIVLLGHAGCGKTSLAESILHITGVTNRLGSVDEGTSLCDYDDEEKHRKISINSAIIHTTHEGKIINVIDTPGYPGFIGSALLSIPAAETAAIVINAASGIEVNTRKLFRAAEAAGKPRMIIINKMDADKVDFAELVSQIQETFGKQCKCANLPSEDKKSVIDCVVNKDGESFMSADKAHTELLESVVEADDELMESYLGGEEVTPEQVAHAFAGAMVTGTVIPIFFTDAREEIGIRRLLEFIVKDLPAPTDEKATLVDGETETEIAADAAGPLAGVVFRVGFDPRSNMKYASIKLYSGSLKSDTSMYHNEDKKPLRPGHILRLRGAETEDVAEGIAGDIVTLAKLDELEVGDLIHDGKAKGRFAMPKVPVPMFSLAFEPAARGDEGKIGVALDKIREEDKCFLVTRNEMTREMVMSGMGDLHLRVILAKLEGRFKVKVNTHEPKIPYKETIASKGEGHYRHKKQTGGAGQFGEVYLRVEPAERGSDPTLDFSWDIFGGSIPGQFEAPIQKGINDIMGVGVIAGCPMQDIKVSVYDGKHHPVDSKEVAFRAAGKGAFLEAVQKAKPTLLEPIVDMEITIPTDNVGDITGDIASRRGHIEGQEVLPGGMIIIKAQVPLAELRQYDSQLKSVTAGQGSYSMELSHYATLPPNVQQQVVAQFEKEKQTQEA